MGLDIIVEEETKKIPHSLEDVNKNGIRMIEMGYIQYSAIIDSLAPCFDIDIFPRKFGREQKIMIPQPIPNSHPIIKLLKKNDYDDIFEVQDIKGISEILKLTIELKKDIKCHFIKLESGVKVFAPFKKFKSVYKRYSTLELINTIKKMIELFAYAEKNNKRVLYR